MLAESAMIQLESLELPTQGLKQMLTGRFPRVKGYLAHGSFGLLIFTLATITATGQTFTTLANFSGTTASNPITSFKRRTATFTERRTRAASETSARSLG